jgi:tetratricopeptide (TPR) repeat protein
MREIYQSTSFCLLCVFGIAGAGQISWEELIRRSDELAGQGKLVEAETTLLSALKAAEVFPPPDLRLAETQHRLGTVYRELGRLPEAEKWYRRSISAWKVSESGLPKPLISLASLYLESGLHGKAERLVDPWLHNPDFKFDAANPEPVRRLHDLAAIQHRKRNYSKADVLYRQALTAAEKTFGPQDREVALLLNNLGLLLADAGRDEEAGHYLERALAIWEGAVPPGHPDLARALTNLAALYCSKRAYAKAEPLFQRALSIAGSSLGPENRLVAAILAEYAFLLRETNRKKEAKLFKTRAHAIWEDQAREQLGRHTIDVRDLHTSRHSRVGKAANLGPNPPAINFQLEAYHANRQNVQKTPPNK